MNVAGNFCHVVLFYHHYLQPQATQTYFVTIFVLLLLLLMTLFGFIEHLRRVIPSYFVAFYKGIKIFFINLLRLHHLDLLAVIVSVYCDSSVCTDCISLTMR